MSRSRRRTMPEGLELVERYAQSGMSQRSFAESEGLMLWYKRLDNDRRHRTLPKPHPGCMGYARRKFHEARDKASEFIVYVLIPMFLSHVLGSW